MSVFKMAWRNIWRNRRRTIVTVAAMSLALLAMICYSGFAQGMLGDLEKKVVEMETGDLQLHAAGYRDKPQIYTRMADADAVLARLREAGFRASGRLLGAGLAASKDQSAGVQFRGVDVAHDKTVTRVQTKIRDGRWLDATDPTGVVLGHRLAKTLGIAVGGKLVVLSQAADGSMANELYTVRGVLRSVSEVVDRAGVYLTAGAYRELFVIPGGAHQIVVRRPADEPLVAAVARAKTLAGPHEVRSWKQLMPTIASMVENARGMLYFMFMLVYIAIAIVILNAMLMAVFERIREFGVLKAIGMGPGMVLRLVLTESALQTALAMLIGLMLSVPCVWYLAVHGVNMTSMAGLSTHGMSWDSIIYGAATPAIFAGPLVTLAVIVALAVLYPAVKAALISPVAAIQHR